MDEESYPFFSDAKINKIKVNTKVDSWQIFLEKETLLPASVFEQLESKKMLLDENASKIDFIWDIKNQDINQYLEYYPLVLKECRDQLHVLEIYDNV